MIDSKFVEKNTEADHATKEELLRQAQWEIQGWKPAINCPKLKGRIISVKMGVQAVETDSKENGKRILHCLGQTYLNGGEVGDWVEMEYKVHVMKNTCMWVGRITEKARNFK